MTKEHKVMLAAIFLVAATMRSPITATGVLTGTIRDALALSSGQAGLITTVPLLIFCITSPILPALSAKFGINRLLFVGMLAVAAGQGIRYFSGYGGFLLGTALMALGISAANVLLPSLLKLEYPTKVGVITSSYISIMTFSAGISAGLTMPFIFQANFTWRGALIIWMSFSLLAALLWSTLQKRPMYPRQVQCASDGPSMPLWRQPLAWQVTAFMGLQSFIYYTLVSWLPDILAAKDVGPGDISLMIFVFQILSIPSAFFAPIIAERLYDQRWIGFLSGAFYLLGAIGLLLAASNSGLFAVIVTLAFGSGATISLAMLFFNQRTRDSVTAGRLSGMAQAIGYFTAALGPVILGRIYDLSQTWTMAIYVLITIGFILTIFGYLSGRRRFVR